MVKKWEVFWRRINGQTVHISGEYIYILTDGKKKPYGLYIKHKIKLVAYFEYMHKTAAYKEVINHKAGKSTWVYNLLYN